MTMANPTSKRVKRAIAAQHPDAGVVVLDARFGKGKSRQVGYRERDSEAAEDVMDMVVLLDAPPVEDPRAKALATRSE